MVVVSKEWQNKCEDVPKTTVNTTTTAVTNTTTVPTTSTTTTTIAATCIPESSNTINRTNIENASNNSRSDPEVLADDLINSITEAASNTEVEISSESLATIRNKNLANDNANNEQINELLRDDQELFKKFLTGENFNEIADNLYPPKKKSKEEDNVEESVLNCNKSLKIMAENTKETPIKAGYEQDETHPHTLINNHYVDSNKDLVEANLRFNSNSNTNTLTLATQKESNRQQNLVRKPEVTFSCPLTSNDLSSALQTALNATNNANNTNISVAAAGLQPNFLSQLALTANVAGLQKSTNSTATMITAKQLNQSLNILDSNNQNKNDSSILENTASITSVPVITYENNGQAKIVLICEGNSHPFQTRTISLTPNVECMVGRLIAKSKASENNAIFDCKVLSRKHAVIWYTPDGKFWVKDTKSSNGTFINDNKLGDEDAELHFGDIVKFGVDVLENSRKEVHGCIIACVKLYMPDGREAISIDSSSPRNQFSGEGRISYDELHRLNLYIQETSQREKVLTSKLCNIQNVLDATRKNSALCWQSMITEDQLLHRIHSLEKKLQFMEKNVPENVLRNEVIKLLDDKSSYQHTAKEALRKVYQERCDAMQMLAKMESAYAQSDNECSVLRDQIMNSKQTLQDVNTRLLRLEAEYNEFKDEVAKQQQDLKEREELRITELTEKLRERELECEDLKKKISEILIKRAEQLEDDEQMLEKQAIEKLDAAIADMDLGDDEDSSDDEANDEVDVDANNVKCTQNEKEEGKNEKEDVAESDNDTEFAIKTKKRSPRPHLASIFAGSINGVDEKEKEEISTVTKIADLTTNKSPPKRVKETTIMKWLQNSDLNKNESSFDIFKAICNENDDESDECGVLPDQSFKDSKTRQKSDIFTINESNLFLNFKSKLKNVQKNLKQLEMEIEEETINDAKDNLQVQIISKNFDDESSDNDTKGACAEEEFIIKSNGDSSVATEKQVLSKENKKYLLLKSSVNILREAYNEIWDTVKEKGDKLGIQENEKEKMLPPITEDKTSLAEPSVLPYTESDSTESDSEVESLTLSSPASGTVINLKPHKSSSGQLSDQLKEYQSKVQALNEKLQQTELDAQHTLEIMQVECDDAKLKIENLNKTIEALKSDKKVLEKMITENENNLSAIETCSLKENDTQLEKELELEEDPLLNAINVTAFEREEELIAYKERLDEQEKQNIDLRNEISLLKLQAGTEVTKNVMLKQYLPCTVLVLAIIIYFVTTYY